MKILLFLVCLFGSNFAVAENYPIKPIRFIVGAASGGGGDTVARIMVEQLIRQLNTNIIVDNRPAAAGVLARQLLQNSEPDGYTVMILSSSQIVNAMLFTNNPVSQSNILVFAGISNQPYWLVVNSKSSFFTVNDLVQAGKVKTNSITYGSFGVGSIAHLAGSLLGKKMQTDFLHIPYKGSAASVQDLLGNQISFVFSSGSAIISHVQSNRLRAIAVSSMSRNKALPNVPTLMELGVKDFNVTGWYALAIHKNTSPKIIDKLSKTTSVSLRDTKVMGQLAAIGSDVWYNDVKSMQKIVKEEELKYLGLVDIKP